MLHGLLEVWVLTLLGLENEVVAVVGAGGSVGRLDVIKQTAEVAVRDVAPGWSSMCPVPLDFSHVHGCCDDCENE